MTPPARAASRYASILEKSGFAGPEAAQIAAHSTRDKKEIHSPSEVLAAHRQLAAEFGNQADQVVQRREAARTASSTRHDPNTPERVQEAVTFAKSRNFEREAVTDERDIMRDALRRGMGDLTYGQVRDNFELRQATGEFQRTSGQKHDTGRQFTTREAIAEELATIKHMQQGQSTIEPIMRREDAAAHGRNREFLNPAQQKAIEEVLTSQDRIHGLQGLAGSGKTTTLEAIRDGAERNGYAVEGFAPTSRAAGQLRDAGIQADTLQGFLARGGVERSAGDPNARHLYMLDESSLASTRQMQSFLEKIGPQDRVLLVGDTRQHQGVDAGKPFEQMQEAGMRTSQLDQIVRQKDPELLRAVEHLSRNETATGIQLLQQQGRITEIPDDRADASRPSPRTMSPARRTRWLSRPTTPAAATSTMPSAQSCRAAALYPKTITPMTRSYPAFGDDQRRSQLGSALSARRRSLLHAREQGTWH